VTNPDNLPADETSATAPSAAKRKAIASLGATILHARNPDAARRYGSRGGRKTAHGFVDGPSAWGKRMALARWHGVPFAYCGGSDALSSERAAASHLHGRAPMAGPGNDGGGAPEPGPAPAQRGQMVRRRRTGLEQARLL
jgi:hypothetical protein